MSGVSHKKFLIFVLIFGLTACTVEKSKRRQDEWRFSPPEIVLPTGPDGLDRSRVKVGQASEHELPLNAELNFPAIDGIVLEVESLCSVAGENYQEQFRVSNSATVKVGSLVPAQALVQQQDKMTCSFEFTAINEHKSRHHFLMPGLKLIEANSFGELNVSEKLQSISPRQKSELPDITTDDLDQLSVESANNWGVPELLCTNFSSHTTARDIQSVDWKILAYKQSAEVLKTVLKKYRQTCRIAVTNEHGLRQEISAPFVLKFPAPELKITAAAPVASSSNSGRTILLEVDLENTSPVDQVIAVPSDNLKKAAVQLVWSYGRGASIYWLTNVLNSAPIRVEIDDLDDEIQKVDGKKIVEIKSGSSVHLRVLAAVDLRQGLGCAGQMFGGPLLNGYLLNFIEPFRVQRLEIGTNNITDEIALFNSLPHHINEAKVFVPFANVKGNWANIASQLVVHELPRCNRD